MMDGSNVFDLLTAYRSHRGLTESVTHEDRLDSRIAAHLAGSSDELICTTQAMARACFRRGLALDECVRRVVAIAKESK